MTSAKYRFSCDTIHEADIIAWLDSFAPDTRRFAIHAAIRAYRVETEPAEPIEYTDTQVAARLDSIEDTLSNIFRELAQLRKSGFGVINRDNNAGEVDGDFSAAKKNLAKYFTED